MKHIYLIGNGSRAAQYGVGTYIRQMLEFFRQTSSVRLTIVELNSEVKEVTEECDNSGKVCYLKIPAQKSEGRKGDVAHCYRNIAYLLALHFLKDEQNVLHLNYLHHATTTREPQAERIRIGQIGRASCRERVSSPV